MATKVLSNEVNVPRIMHFLMDMLYLDNLLNDLTYWETTLQNLLAMCKSLLAYKHGRYNSVVNVCIKCKSVCVTLAERKVVYGCPGVQRVQFSEQDIASQILNVQSGRENVTGSFSSTQLDALIYHPFYCEYAGRLNHQWTYTQWPGSSSGSDQKMLLEQY